MTVAAALFLLSGGLRTLASSGISLRLARTKTKQAKQAASKPPFLQPFERESMCLNVAPFKTTPNGTRFPKRRKYGRLSAPYFLPFENDEVVDSLFFYHSRITSGREWSAIMLCPQSRITRERIDSCHTPIILQVAVFYFANRRRRSFRRYLLIYGRPVRYGNRNYHHFFVVNSTQNPVIADTVTPQTRKTFHALNAALRILRFRQHVAQFAVNPVNHRARQSLRLFLERCAIFNRPVQVPPSIPSRYKSSPLPV